MPTDINYRANIYALKQEGCTHVVVTTACGSLKEEYKPGDLVFPDQFIDRTTKRVSTFYDGKEGSPVGICHMPMHDPYCPHTRKVINIVFFNILFSLTLYSLRQTADFPKSEIKTIWLCTIHHLKATDQQL